MKVREEGSEEERDREGREERWRKGGGRTGWALRDEVKILDCGEDAEEE